MADNKNMRYNPYWYQGLDYIGQDEELSNISEDIDMNGHGIINLKDPVNDQDAASKKYVDDAIAASGGGPGGGPLQASQIHSQAVGNIQATNVQDAIQEISNEAAFLNAPNTFTEEATFNQVPKLGTTTVASNDPKSLASVEQVSNLIDAKKVTADEVSVDQTTPFETLKGANVQEVVKKADEEISKLKDHLAFAGTYDAAADKVLDVVPEVVLTSGIVKDAPLPVAAFANENLFLFVKTKGTGQGNAPQIDLNPGDILYSTKDPNAPARGAWILLRTSIDKIVKASEVTVSQNPALNNFKGTNVQDVLVEADNYLDDLSDLAVSKTSLVGIYDASISQVKLAFTGAIANTGIQQGQDLPASKDENKNIYLFVSAGGRGPIAGDLKVGDFVFSTGTSWERINTGDYLLAKNIGVDTIAGLGGPNNVQTALESVSNKIKDVSDRIDNLNAESVSFDNTTSSIPDSPAGDAVNTVQKAIDGLDRKYITKSGGTLDSSLNANNKQINNLADGTNPGDAVNKKQLDDMVSILHGSGTSLVGRYNANTNLVIESFGVDASSGITAGAQLPNASATNKNMYLYVSEPGTGSNPVPNLTFNVGDLIFSDGNSWQKIETSKSVKAEEVSVDNTQGVTGANVQEALQNLASRPISAQASSIIVTPEIADLPGANVQEVLKGAATKIKANTDNNDALKQRVDNLNATQVSFDNQTSNIPGQNVDTVQKAVDGVITRLNSDNAVSADHVSFDPANGNLTKTNVQEAIDELKAGVDQSVAGLDAIYVKKTGGELTGPLNANSQKITSLGDPTDSADAANKKYVDTQGANYVTKTGGQLTGALNANDQAINNLLTPGGSKDAVNVEYLTNQLGNYVTKTNGELASDLDANGNKIINLGAPKDPHNAVNLQYVAGELAKYVTKNNGVIESDLNAQTHKIINLGDGTADSDAVNKGQVDALINSLQDQLTGKLTFVGTYDASTNQIASVNQAISAQFPEYQVNQSLPADAAKFKNNFLIVTVKGTGTAPAPAEALNVGDLIYSSGTGWGFIPLGKTTAAANVSVDAIQQLPGVSDVQTALETIALRPAGAATATTTSFNPAGNIVATNVQAALEELDTEKAADNQVVKLTGNQTINGIKTFSQKIENTSEGASYIFKVSGSKTSFFEWRGPDDVRYGWFGFGNASKPAIQFNNSKANGFFEFNKVCRYESDVPISDPKDSVHKKYCDQNYVALSNRDQNVDGVKTFLKNIRLQLNDADPKFNFVKEGFSGSAVPVKMSLIGNPYPQTGVSMTRVFGFEYQQDAAPPIGPVNFVLKMKSHVNSDYFWFRLSHTPNFKEVNCYVSGNKLVFKSIKVANGSDGHGAPTTTNNGVVLDGVANATADMHALNRRTADVRYVRTDGGDQTVLGVKTFGTEIKAGHGAGYVKFSPEDDTVKTLKFSNSSVGNRNQFNLDLERKVALANLKDPTNDYDAVHKKYVDSFFERVQDVDVTAAITSLTNKGSLLFSYRLTRDPETRDILTALFGMKLTLTTIWNPGSSTTPVELPGCDIAGEEYYKGLPVAVDASLIGGGFKTVAQIRLVKVVPDGGINQPQADTPLLIGRIVCKIDGGNTKLYAVFNHNSDIAVPTETGAFFTVRYEGLPSMVI